MLCVFLYSDPKLAAMAGIEKDISLSSASI